MRLHEASLQRNSNHTSTIFDEKSKSFANDGTYFDSTATNIHAMSPRRFVPEKIRWTAMP